MSGKFDASKVTAPFYFNIILWGIRNAIGDGITIGALHMPCKAIDEEENHIVVSITTKAGDKRKFKIEVTEVE